MGSRTAVSPTRQLGKISDVRIGTAALPPPMNSTGRVAKSHDQALIIKRYLVVVLGQSSNLSGSEAITADARYFLEGAGTKSPCTNGRRRERKSNKP
jgi:hypothetical protein